MMNELEQSDGPANWVVIVAILLLAAFFRLYQLPVVPRGLSQDEVVNADISLSLLQGNHTPFLAGGYGHEPLYHYLQAVSLVLFGDNAVGIRFPSAAAGILLIAVSYVVMRLWFGHVSALTTAAGLAVSWWPTIFSRLGIRAITLPLLLACAVWFFWRGARTGPAGVARPRARNAPCALAGMLLGLTFYTYTAASIVPILVLAWLIYGLVFQRAALQEHWREGVLTLCIAVLTVMPLFLYLHAHPELTQRLQQLSEPLSELRKGNPTPLWRSARATLGMFSTNGEGRWAYGIPSRAIFEPASGALFYVGLILCIAFISRPPYGLMLIWLIIALLPSMVTPDAPSTIRAIGATPAVYGIVGVAVGWIWRKAGQHSRTTKGVVLAGLVLMLLGNAIFTFRDGFQRWAGNPKVYWLYKTHFADIANFLDDQPQPQPMVVFEEWVAPLDIHGLRLDLRDDTRMPRWVQSGQAFIWPAGASMFTLAVPIYSSTDPDIWHLFAGDPPVLAASAYEMEDGRPGVTFYQAESEPILRRTMKQVTTDPISIPGQSQRLTTPVRFGNEFDFLEYEVLNSVPQGGALRIVTIWRVIHDAPMDSSIFVHLLDADGTIVGQHDGFDVWTPALKSDDIVAQLHMIEIRPDVTAGSYRLQAGIYTRAEKERLPVRVDGKIVADQVWLKMAEVTQ